MSYAATRQPPAAPSPPPARGPAGGGPGGGGVGAWIPDKNIGFAGFQDWWKGQWVDPQPQPSFMDKHLGKFTDLGSDITSGVFDYLKAREFRKGLKYATRYEPEAALTDRRQFSRREYGFQTATNIGPNVVLAAGAIALVLALT